MQRFATARPEEPADDQSPSLPWSAIDSLLSQWAVHRSTRGAPLHGHPQEKGGIYLQWQSGAQTQRKDLSFKSPLQSLSTEILDISLNPLGHVICFI